MIGWFVACAVLRCAPTTVTRAPAGQSQGSLRLILASQAVCTYHPGCATDTRWFGSRHLRKEAISAAQAVTTAPLEAPGHPGHLQAGRQVGRWVIRQAEQFA